MVQTQRKAKTVKNEQTGIVLIKELSKLRQKDRKTGKQENRKTERIAKVKGRERRANQNGPNKREKELSK